jgi:hypothetical protein
MVTLFVLFAACTVLLAVVFPIWREIEYAKYPLQYWLGTYFGTAIAVTAGFWIANFACKAIVKRQSVWVSALLFFVVTACLAIFLGTRDAGEQLAFPSFIAVFHAKFLAEWQFVRFVIFFLLPFSLCAARIINWRR